jgi:hypothetical protein
MRVRQVFIYEIMWWGSTLSASRSQLSYTPIYSECLIIIAKGFKFVNPFLKENNIFKILHCNPPE